MSSQVGSYPLTGTGDLPNVHVAFPGEHWSDAVASGDIDPGEAVIVDNIGDTLVVRPVVAGDNGDPRVAVAKHVVEIPDVNTGPSALGPNEIVNGRIVDGDYVHRYLSGAFVLSLVDPTRTYAKGDLVGWDIDGTRPAGKGGTPARAGAWAPNANADVDSIFEIQDIREYGDDGEVLLNVRSTRGQF